MLTMRGLPRNMAIDGKRVKLLISTMSSFRVRVWSHALS